MIAIAFGFLVYFEMNSRRNARKQQQASVQNQPTKPTDR
jgi:hypothetical protein